MSGVMYGVATTTAIAERNGRLGATGKTVVTQFHL